jgi:hydroxymethylbilane synthase
MKARLRIASRASKLAMLQATLVKNEILLLAPGLDLEICPIQTSGDRLKRGPLADAGGKGLFIRELEQALSSDKADIAVHSMKDLPALIPEQYRIAAVPGRENSRDVIVSRGGGIDTLPTAARVGTASPRRKFELLDARPDLRIELLRGNVDTRLGKLAAGDFDAVVLAAAGLKRMGLFAKPPAGLFIEELPEDRFVPAGGQGALAIEALAGQPIAASREIEELIGRLDVWETHCETSAERSFLVTIGASCNSPVGVHGALQGDRLMLRAVLFSPDGVRKVADAASDTIRDQADAVKLGVALAKRMLAAGAVSLLRSA